MTRTLLIVAARDRFLRNSMPFFSWTTGHRLVLGMGRTPIKTQVRSAGQDLQVPIVYPEIKMVWIRNGPMTSSRNPLSTCRALKAPL